LATDEVYAVLAYLLNLGGIVPADFTLTDKNIAEIDKRLPNRNGKIFYRPLWETRGKGDVVNAACMKDCPVDGGIDSSLPDGARNAQGNIAEQVRPFGPARGTDTSQPRRTALVGTGPVPAGVRQAASSPAAPVSSSRAQSDAAGALALAEAQGCTACHGLANKIVGPSFQEVARKYAGRTDAPSYLAGKIRGGGQGVWGAIPMPAQPAVKEADAHALAAWLAKGAK
jgi:cytochrome c